MAPLSPIVIRLSPPNAQEAEPTQEERSPASAQPKRTVRKRKKDPVQEDVQDLVPSGEDKSAGEEEGEAHESLVGSSPDPPSTPSVPDASETGRNKKPASKRRKVEASAETDSSKTAGPKKKKNDVILEQFMMDTLPALRKNMKQAKAAQSSFKIRDHGEYFKTSSKHLATFILPLFQFLGKEEIICSRIADFDGKKFVKTDAGFHHASFIINHALDISDEERDYIMKKYGKEYFKIPSKDYVKAASASKYGDKGEFKVTIIGLYEDSFLDSEGKEVLTINPVLRYDPVRTKPEKAEKKEKKEKKEKADE